MRLNSPDSVDSLDNLKVSSNVIISSDSSNLFYRATLDLNTRFELYSLCIKNCSDGLIPNSLAPAVDLILQQ